MFLWDEVTAFSTATVLWYNIQVNEYLGVVGMYSDVIKNFLYGFTFVKQKGEKDKLFDYLQHDAAMKIESVELQHKQWIYCIYKVTVEKNCFFPFLQLLISCQSFTQIPR